MFGFEDDERDKVSNTMRAAMLNDQLAEDSGVGIGVRLGITAKSAIYGLANNAIQVGNFFSSEDDQTELVDIADKIDQSFGSNAATSYRSHETGYNLAGDLVSSFVPIIGTAKFLKLAKMGKLGSTAKTIANPFGRSLETSADDIAMAYRTQGSAADVAASRFKMFKNSFVQQAYEGALYSAAVEVSLNAGDILNKEGASATEKALMFGESLLFGAVAQGAIGGYFVYRGLNAGTKEVAAKVFKQDEAPFLYNSPSTTGLSSGSSAAKTLFEIDRIEAIPAINELQQKSKAANLALAKQDLSAAVNKLFPEAKASEVDPVKQQIFKMLDTPQGRQEAYGLLARANKFEPLEASIFSPTGRMAQVYSKSPNIASVAGDEFAKLGANGSKYHFDGEKLIVNADAPMTLTEGKNALLDFTMRKLESAKSGIAKFEPQLERFKLTAALEGKDDFEVMKQAYDMRSADVNEFREAHGAIDKYFTTIGKDVAEAIYNPKNVVFMDTATGAITETPISHLGDIGKMAFSPMLKQVSWIDQVGNTVVHTAKEAHASLGTTTNLLDYQAKRVLVSTFVSDFKPARLDLEKLSVVDAYKLEAAISSKHIKGGKYMFAKNGLDANKVHEAIARVKAAEYDRLMQADPNLDANSVTNSLGVSTKFVETQGKLGTYTSSLGVQGEVSVDDVISPASNLMRRRTYALQYDKVDDAFADNAYLFAHFESQRALEIANIRTVVDGTLFDGAFSKYLPDDLNPESVIGFGAARFTSNAAQIGGYQSLITKAVQVGDHIARVVENKFNADILPKLKASAQVLLKSPAARAEYAAIKEFYYGQEAKFFSVSDGVYVADRSIGELTSAMYKGTDLATALKGLKENADFFTVKNVEVIAYMKTLSELNSNYVSQPKKIIMDLLGKDTLVNPKALYLPPRDYKHMTFIVADAGSPLDQFGHKVYRIVANDKDSLRQQVNEALSYAAKNGLRWIEQSSSDVDQYKKAKLAFEWEGETISRGFSNSSIQRNGAVQGITPEVDAAQLIVEEADWFKRQLMSTHRAGVQLYYAEDIGKINSLIRMAESSASTDLGSVPGIKVKFGSGVAKASKPSDIEQVLITALGGDDSGFSWWKMTNNFLEDWAATGLNTVSGAFSRLKGKRDIKLWGEEGKRVAEELRKKGIGLPMGDYIADRLVRNNAFEPGDVKKIVSIANMVESTLRLRLDFADPIVNTLGAITKISGETQYLKAMYKQMGETQRAAFDQEMTALGGMGMGAGGKPSVLSSAKMFAKSSAEYWTDDGAKKIQRWIDMGLMVKTSKVLRDAFEEMRIDASTLKSGANADSIVNKFVSGGGKIIDTLAKPSDWSNEIAQFAALNIAERMGTAAGLSSKELSNFMFSFNRRVNAITNPMQKPRLFQGSAGIALSLYQSYMFHMMNNMFRYADRGVKSAPAMVAALNGTFFGAQSLPGFTTLNNMIASREMGHTDLYGATATMFGSDVNNADLFDFVMYGAGSTVLQANLYSRGGLSPRSPVLIPTSVSELPVANTMMKFVSSVTESAKRISYGDSIGSSVLDGVVDIGMNRPLKGVRDVLQGKALDGNGNTIAFHDDVFSLATAVRTIGLKPLNQAIVGDMQSRLLAYKAQDTSRKLALGEEIRRIHSSNPEIFNKPETFDRWRNMYVRAGGKPAQFDEFLQDQLIKSRDDLSQRLDKLVKSNIASQQQYNALLGI